MAALSNGRIEPERGSDSEPQTCHSRALRDKLFERALKDGLWPRAPVRGCSREPPFGTFGLAVRLEKPPGRPAALSDQISVCSEISSASSTSMPRYRTVDSSLEWPSSSCTARKFLVRR